jgi:hypothetical protein
MYIYPYSISFILYICTASMRSSPGNAEVQRRLIEYQPTPLQPPTGTRLGCRFRSALIRIILYN